MLGGLCTYASLGAVLLGSDGERSSDIDEGAYQSAREDKINLTTRVHL